MSEYFVGETIDHKALGKFSTLLRTAYENARINNATLDWSDVSAALQKAVEAFGEDGQSYIAAANDGFDVEPAVTYPVDASWDVRAAATLLFAYRYPEDVDLEDVDSAWEILLQSDIEHGMKPN